MKKIFLLILLGLLTTSVVNAQGVTQCLVNSVWVPCSSAPQPSFAQASVSSKSSGSVASINAAYGSNTLKGNTLVVVFSNGNNNNAASPITDTLSLTWFKAVQVANGSAFETEIWYAPNSVGGADTVTVTPGGTNASIAMTIYEVQGLLYPAANSSPVGPQALDQTTSNTGTGGTSPAVSLTPIVPNEYVFAGFGLGTAAQTITVVSPYNNDSGQQNPTTPAGLFSFVSASLFKPEIVATTPSATATSEPWAVAVASFKTLTNPNIGTMNESQISGTPVDTNSGTKSAGTQRVVIATDQPQLTNKLLVTPDPTIPEPSGASGDAVSACNILSAASNNSTSCKGSTGNFFGYEIYNNTTTIYYLRLYNSSSAPTCSSATGFIRTIPIPPAGASGQAGGAISNQFYPTNYSTGIGYCITGGSSSTDNTNAAAGVFGEIRYK